MRASVVAAVLQALALQPCSFEKILSIALVDKYPDNRWQGRNKLLKKSSRRGSRMMVAKLMQAGNSKLRAAR